NRNCVRRVAPQLARRGRTLHCAGENAGVGNRATSARAGVRERRIVARGEMPFLHVYSDNEPAIALYRRQGLSIRAMHVTVVKKPDAAAQGSEPDAYCGLSSPESSSG